MCVTDNDASESSRANAATRPSNGFDKAAPEVLPGLDDLFADPQARRRIGELIAGAARRANASKR
jgi:hypothetical protein